jgi:hypothetical protein
MTEITGRRYSAPAALDETSGIAAAADSIAVTAPR